MSSEEEYNNYMDNINNLYLPLNTIDNTKIQNINKFMNKYYGDINIFLGFLYYYLHQIQTYKTKQEFMVHITMCYNKYKFNYRKIFNSDFSNYEFENNILKIDNNITMFFENFKENKILKEKLKDENKYKYLINTVIYFINEYNIEIYDIKMIDYIIKIFIKNYNCYFDI